MKHVTAESSCWLTLLLCCAPGLNSEALFKWRIDTWINTSLESPQQLSDFLPIDNPGQLFSETFVIRMTLCCSYCGKTLQLCQPNVITPLLFGEKETINFLFCEFDSETAQFTLLKSLINISILKQRDSASSTTGKRRPAEAIWSRFH